MYQKELENYKIYINEKESEIQSKQEEILNLKHILVEKKANQVQKRQYDEICFQITDYYSTKKTLLEINRINVQILEIQNEIKETDLVLEKKKKLLGIILSQIHSLKID
ncbi:hypothetical protein HDV04_002768 [Boothiomyces sp. JEL0838]|nr:hypothetical protein HDV04_002768 [Boothiomyces sp. JEL0838]